MCSYSRNIRCDCLPLLSAPWCRNQHTSVYRQYWCFSPRKKSIWIYQKVHIYNSWTRDEKKLREWETAISKRRMWKEKRGKKRVTRRIYTTIKSTAASYYCVSTLSFSLTKEFRYSSALLCAIRPPESSEPWILGIFYFPTILINHFTSRYAFKMSARQGRSPFRSMNL